MPANVVQWSSNLVAAPTQAGVPEVDLTFIGGAAVASTSAQLGVNLVTVSTAATVTIVDGLLDRDMSLGADNGSSAVRTPRQALRFLRNQWSLDGSTLTVTKEDDTTVSWTAVVTASSGATPITGADPA